MGFMNITLNQVAIWRPAGAEELDKRLSPAGQTYYEAGNPVAKRAQEPLARYVKDYAIDKVKFSLFVRTALQNDKAIEESLDKCAKALTKAQVLECLSDCQGMDFVYLKTTLNNKGELNNES